ncbi:MAG: hypothetical protein WA776_08295 [Xanthobacteraceae bacterium]|jgi:hypothetical protein
MTKKPALSPETSKEPTDHTEMVVKVAKEATATWMKDAGKIGDRGEFDVTKKFSEYNISPAELSELSRVVVTEIKQSTGKELKLPPDLPSRYHGASIHHFITALPGHPSIPSSGPMRSAYSPLAGRPQTTSSGPIGKGRAKPGGK